MEKKFTLATFCLFIFIVICIGMSLYYKVFRKDRVLILYFSSDDVIKDVAKDIKKSTSGDLVEIEPTVKYSTEHTSWYNLAYDEYTNSSYPLIDNDLPDLSKYDVVYIGYPIWFNDMPRIMYSLFKKYDFKGTTIKPFYYSEDSKGSWTTGQIMLEEEKARVSEGLLITNSDYNKELQEWLNK